jgi:hypothetical protein
MPDVLHRSAWDGTPVKGGDLFVLTKTRGCKVDSAICEVWSHQLGWELRLLIAGELQQSQVCRAAHEWLDTKDAWRVALLERGWS